MRFVQCGCVEDCLYAEHTMPDAGAVSYRAASNVEMGGPMMQDRAPRASSLSRANQCLAKVT